MSIVKHTDKRTGVTYVYESESYWDKEKKQPRSKRTLIGKVDEITGEIVPTGKSGRKKSPEEKLNTDSSSVITDQVASLAEKDALITQLKAEIRQLKKQKQDILSALEAITSKWS